MKEITSAVAALQKRAGVLLKLASALTHVEAFTSTSTKRRKVKKHISNAGRQRIRIAQQKRWAAFRKAKKKGV